MEDIYHSIYEKMDRMGIFFIRHYAVIESPPYTPLCIDRLDDTVYALSQNPVIDGNVVADPDMEVRVVHAKRIAEPLCLQDQSGRRVVYTGPGRVDLKTKNDLARLLDNWLSDLIAKGFILYQ
jgi:uncharacterized protein YqiB (DUF1249 family)